MERHRAHKKMSISDQQKRRDVALERQKQQRRDVQDHFRQLTLGAEPQHEQSEVLDHQTRNEWGLAEGTRLQGSDARAWFSRQFMLPEWLIDIPSRLKQDWYVMARPSGKRCIVLASRGSTVSRLRNGRVLHHFPSALPSGARNSSGSAQPGSFSILDCIFHEADQTYYVLDMMCWRGYSLYDCNTEFRLFWRDSKLAEAAEVLGPPSTYHRYSFSLVPVYECNAWGLRAAYEEQVPFVRDGILLYNRHAHYTVGYTPLALLWKDGVCSQYFLETDAKGEVPSLQQVVLELKEDGNVGTSDEPAVILGTMPKDFLHENIKPGTLLRFAIGTDGLNVQDGTLIAADIHYQGPGNRNRAGADSWTKILFQYAARHSPVGIADILSAIESSEVDMD